MSTRRWTHAACGFAALATVAGFTLRWLWMLGSPNFDGSDPATRALLGRMLARWGWAELYGQTVWPPLHFWLIAWAERLTGDLQLGARGLSVLGGALSAGGAAALAARTTEQRQGPGPAVLLAAVVAGSLVATSELSMRLSALSYAEPVAVAFVAAAMLALSAGQPVWSAVWLSFAVGLRFEYAALLLLLAWSAPRWSKAWALLPTLPIALWLGPRPGSSAFNTLVRSSSDRIESASLVERVEALRQLAAWSLADGWFLWFLLLLASAAGATLVLPAPDRRLPRSRPADLASLGLGLAGAALVGTTALGHVPPFPRYLLLLHWLLAVAVATALAQLTGSPLRRRVAAALVATLALLGWQRYRAALLRVPPPAVAEDALAEAIAERLELAPGMRLYVDPLLRTDSYVVLASGADLASSPRFYRDPRGDRDLALDLERLLHGLGPALVATTSGGDFEVGLGIEPGCGSQRIADTAAVCLFEREPYRLFLLAGQR